jgi:hypothetical protein
MLKNFLFIVWNLPLRSCNGAYLLIYARNFPAQNWHAKFSPFYMDFDSVSHWLSLIDEKD